jgi:hypothetical protein
MKPPAALERFRLLPRWRRIFIGTLVFMLIFFIASFAPLAAQCVRWQSASTAAFFLQESFSGGTLLTWAVFLLGGYVYTALVVAAVSEIWTDSFRRVTAIVVYGSTAYWLGPVFSLGHGVCAASERDVAAILPHNFVYFGLVQLFSQWFTLLDSVPQLSGIVFTREGMRKFTVLHWVVVASLITLIFSLVGVQLYYLYALNRLQWYILALVMMVVMLVASVRIADRLGWDFHFHHYCVGGLVVFFPVPGVGSSIAQAILVGICVEGLSRWGPDPIFSKRHKQLPMAVQDETPTPSPLPMALAPSSGAVGAGTGAGTVAGTVAGGTGSTNASSVSDWDSRV